MSHIVIKVFSFECDWPGCDVDATEVIEPCLREARQTLRATEHWTVDRVGRDICPKHVKRGWMTHDGVTLSAQPYDEDTTVQVDNLVG